MIMNKSIKVINGKKYKSINEAVYQFKRYTNTQMDKLDAELHRAGFRGTPDFNKMTYTTDEISSKLDKIIKRKGGKKIKESVSVNEKVSQVYMMTVAFDRLLKKQTKGKQPTIKDLEKVYDIMRKRYKDLDLDARKESVNEKVARPFSAHLRKAQDEIEYMISNGPTPDGDDGVYGKPMEAMKLLQIAQKSLGKIK